MVMNNSSKKLAWLPLVVAFAVVLGMFIGFYIQRNNSSRGDNIYLYPRSNKILNVLKLIEAEYVDTISIDRLTDQTIVSLLKQLDPHSAYIPASELQAVTEPLEGNFSGIGVQFNMQNDTVVIVNTIPNGPSALIGIQAGDRIIKVNDTVVAGVKMSSDAIVKRLKGPRGTKVKVTIYRPSTRRQIDYDITRNTIPLYSVDVSYMLAPQIGYIKINQFARTTYDEFVTAINKLHMEGMNKLIVDLRGNGGGYLDVAIKIADQFLDENRLIVYTQGRAKPREDFFATASGICQSDSVIILIDEFSASASEILAGAIQDNDRGLIIGRRSFGKGLVQEQIPLSDGSALRLTVARYYTPTGRCIQKPYAPGSDDYYKDITQRYLHGEFLTKDSIKLNDSLKYVTPGGRIVYGGGGIMPDIFIGIDTSEFSKLYNEITDRGLIYRFAFQFSDNNRASLSKFKSVEALRAELRKRNVLDLFIDYIRKQGINVNANDVKNSKRLITTQLEAYICRNFFDNQGFYPIMGEIDYTLKRAVEVFSKP
ncbi:MAG TPA: S41 family peptidase [Bacteroidales bacterium]|nr:S41 family peptidase [Bacteroidales bacterium]HPO66033.1 S41 family peptidase [Bacteroidales bacterium]